ncbi:alpha-L-fucosidase [Diaporthe helianthi]|uniref:alpha-L-fucosidase n=1 Tax=Diaporthe helianthi TaxID=158607 RepID=A0A2P5I900_DIAHE|nr:alpha-L-fucosidase [Diaporthe helianthi]
MRKDITGQSSKALVGLLWLSGRALAAHSVPIDLTAYFNNKAFGTFPNETAFENTLNRSFPPLNHLTQDGIYTSKTTGVRFDFPSYTGPKQPDNLICSGQTIPVASSSISTSKAFSLSMLIANDARDSILSYNLTYLYADGTEAETELRALPFFSFLTLMHGELITPYTWTPRGRDWNTSQIFEFTGHLDPTKTLAAVRLPVADNTTVGRVHVFSMSLVVGDSTGGAGGGAAVEVQSVRPTQKWTVAGNQVVEVTLNNAGSECVSGPGLVVSLDGLGVSTAETGSVKRLCPGDQKRVNIGVSGSANSTDVTVTLSGPSSNQTASFPGVNIGFESFTADLDSLVSHESPVWFDNAKYGIFIHWGPYAVPGYGGVAPNETYAEWFWWYSNNHFNQADKSDTYGYRLERFGPGWNYDDGFPEFTASAWDPKEWVDLFAEAGATYFVLTTKHHDGFALFDAGETTNRSSINYGPRRDIVQELFDAAATYQPTLKRGTYFSLPEWYNSDFGPYGFVQHDTVGSTSWVGIPATNPFTNLTEPYTGHLPIGDFIDDLMYPQMETLAYKYGSDIMWCDAGTANKTAEFASAWWNWARAQDRQVVMNSRCGVAQASDFETPEYSTYSSAQRHKWESNQGMDPYSYGYNAQTPAESYMNASTIVYSLVDMVAKNGNLLLDIGPRADGTIVEAEVANLRRAGKWIHAHAEAIFNTTYWFVQTQIASPQEVRFTQTDDAFYILFLEHPDIAEDGHVWVNATVPVLEGDTISMVGVNATGVDDLSWKTSPEGYLAIDVPAEALSWEEFGWVFRVMYA